MYIFPDFIYSLAKLLFDRLSKQKEFSHVSLSYLFLSSMFIVSARAAKHARSFLVRLHSKWHNCKKKNLIYKGCVARILRFHHTLHKADTTDGRNWCLWCPCGYVKNTKTKRIMNRTTRNAINIICPLMPAFFITMATLFCTSTTQWDKDMLRR